MSIKGPLANPAFVNHRLLPYIVNVVLHALQHAKAANKGDMWANSKAEKVQGST